MAEDAAHYRTATIGQESRASHESQEMSVPGWFILGLPDTVIWDWAEMRRMQRPDDELRQRDAHLARQRVRFILRRLVSR